MYMYGCNTVQIKMYFQAYVMLSLKLVLLYSLLLQFSLKCFSPPQVVTNRDTQETLLCIAFVFEVSTSDHGAQYHVYRLVKD